MCIKVRKTINRVIFIGRFARLGFAEAPDLKDPEDEVNEYLMRAIDARSIDRLRNEHCQVLLLIFKDKVKERKVTIHIVYFYIILYYYLYVTKACLWFLCLLVHDGKGSYVESLLLVFVSLLHNNGVSTVFGVELVSSKLVSESKYYSHENIMLPFSVKSPSSRWYFQLELRY